MDTNTYKLAWTRDESLENLNKRIHDGVNLDNLWERAVDRRDTFFKLLFPYGQPKAGAKVMELGSGVGWIMQSMLDGFELASIVGLDISKNTIEKANERWHHEKASFTLYDGLNIPFPDDTFDNIYSVACIQHIEKHHAFIIFQELLRVLKPEGHATLHLLSIHHLPRVERPYREECLNHINNVPAHWHHYYSYDEIFVLFSEILKVTDLDIRFHRTSFWVHFSKPTDNRFHSKEIESDYFLNRLKQKKA
ncbi:MAG: class I SAM-dependent methyltransferase [Methylococcaceae bacterium]|nr:class I SAM-dependent methyltransferase [Methylococcaceae bacterium]